MPEGTFPALSLVMRYVFIALCVLIVLHSFLWLRRDRRRRHERIRRLPDAGMIGEFVVLDGAGMLKEDTVLPVPWEGCLGSGKSCDIVLEGSNIAPVHLYYSFHTKTGLTLETAGKRCSCYVDGEEQTFRMRNPARLMHGSILQIGDYVLRLRLFAGLHEATAGRTEKADMANYGMKIGSQGMPRPSIGKGWKNQTEREGYQGLHLVEDEGKPGQEKDEQNRTKQQKERKKK